MTGTFEALETGVRAALETYSNVHRGSGHASIATTRLYERAREIALEHLGVRRREHALIFCTPRRAAALESQLDPAAYRRACSRELGLPLGVVALAVRRNALPKGAPLLSGGGTARLVSAASVIWAKAPDRFEAGTPAVVNVIAFAAALRALGRSGGGAFRSVDGAERTAAEILYRDELEPHSGLELLARLRHGVIGRGVRVPTRDGDRAFVNLDNAASTRAFEPVWDAFCRTWRQPERVRREIVSEVRSICGELLGAPPAAYDVIFTGNTTEAINLVAESLRNADGAGAGTVVLNTFLEHNSNELPWRTTPGCSLVRLPVDAEGFADPGELEALLGDYNERGLHGARRVRLVAVSGASNVLGAFNDLEAIARITHRHGAHLLVDAAQAVAHRRIDMEGCGIDYLAFSAHKAYAPFGSGALVARKGLLAFDPDAREQIRSSGEENAAGIAALGKALVLLRRIGLDLIREEEQALTGRALAGLAQIPGLEVYGVQDPSSPRFSQRGGVIAFELKGAMPDRVARELAERGGIGVRYGCHCAHLLIKRLLGITPFLEKVQAAIVTLLPHINLPGVTRVSFGIENDEEDVDALLRVLGEIARSPRAPRGDVARRIDGFAEAAAERVYESLRTATRASS
jgi:selenocysteine lyase/cysteine desulfurase